MRLLLALVVAALLPASLAGDVRLPSSAAPRKLVAASDGSLWFSADRCLGRITAAGEIAT